MQILREIRERLVFAATLGAATLFCFCMVSDVRAQPTLGVPDVSGHQLLFIYDARDNRIPFLSLSNPSNESINLDVAFYGTDLEERLATARIELGPAANTVVDPTQLVNGTAGLAIVTPVVGLLDSRPVVPPAPLTGGFTLANTQLEAGFGQNPFARFAVDQQGDLAPSGSLVDGGEVSYERFAPTALTIPVFFNPQTLSPASEDGNRVMFASFDDVYSADGFEVSSRDRLFETFFYDSDGNSVGSSPTSSTMAGVLLTDLDGFGVPVTSLLDTSAKAFFRFESTEGNVFGLFSQSIGTYAAAQRMPAVASVPRGLESITVNFDARVNGEPFACGRSYTGIGTTNATIEPLDCRMYIQDLRLVGASGEEAPVSLDQDGTWQYENVALLDFEDGTGLCDRGTSELNTSIRGTVAGGEYTRVRFSMGVPEALNHGSAATAPSPLNKTALFWSWNDGYKFIRYDNRVEESGSEFRIHIGSSLCTGDGRGNSTCANANRIEVDLPFEAVQDGILIDLASFFVGTNVEENEAAPGCMSTPGDPECATVFARAGLSDDGNPTGSQQIFLVD